MMLPNSFLQIRAASVSHRSLLEYDEGCMDEYSSPCTGVECAECVLAAENAGTRWKGRCPVCGCPVTEVEHIAKCDNCQSIMYVCAGPSTTKKWITVVAKPNGVGRLVHTKDDTI